jgi:hypothetical protein
LSSAVLPAPFTLDPTPSTQSRAQDMTITFAPASTDPMTLQIDGSCIETYMVSVPVLAGGVAIAAGSVHKVQGQNIPDTCAATITLSRTRAGALDPAFGNGGTIRGEQVRKADVTTTL